MELKRKEARERERDLEIYQAREIEIKREG